MQQMLILLIAVPVKLLLEKGKRALSLFFFMTTHVSCPYFFNKRLKVTIVVGGLVYVYSECFLNFHTISYFISFFGFDKKYVINLCLFNFHSSSVKIRSPF